MVALLTWIAAHSGYAVPETRPNVVVMAQADFELYLCEEVEQCDSPMPHAEIVALFDFPSRTIYIRQGFNPQDLEDQSTMVRQLARGPWSPATAGHATRDAPRVVRARPDVTAADSV
jgi:hypothetical protein